jgi:hypothetical protein
MIAIAAYFVGLLLWGFAITASGFLPEERERQVGAPLGWLFFGYIVLGFVLLGWRLGIASLLFLSITGTAPYRPPLMYNGGGRRPDLARNSICTIAMFRDGFAKCKAAVWRLCTC